jgi:hypothetical protein
MAYTPQQRAQFVLWFVGCNNDYAAFGIKVRRELGQRAKVPGREAIKDWVAKFLATSFNLRISRRNER